MRVAMVYLSGGGLSGGGRNTLLALAPAMRRDPRVERLDVFVPPRAVGRPDLQSLSPRTWPVRDRWLGWAGLQRQLHVAQPDVVFIPNAAWFPAAGLATVCMVRNTEAILAPFGGNPWSIGLKNVLRAQVARRCARRATRIIAVSQFVRDLLIDRWRVPSRKIGVVYHGVAPAGQERRPASASAGVFWLAAGSFLPYRGYEDVLRALARRVQAGADERLLLAGQDVYSDAYRRRIRALAAELGLSDRVHDLGYVGREEMAGLFRHALGFVMTSRLEACPNLALEAMRYGAMSIATSCPPMPEIFGATARFYAAGRDDELARQMEIVAQLSDAQRAEEARRAQTRAEAFSWSAAAAGTIEQLKIAIRGSEA